MSSSVDGLVSGLNTSDLIAQLMKAEAAPQQRLRTKAAAQSAAITAYQAINKQMTGLQTGAFGLTQATAWQAVTATSSSTAAVASATVGAQTGQVTFDITSLAKSHVLTSVVAANGPVTTGAGLDITVGAGAPVHIAVTTDTAAGVASAINAANAGVNAAVVSTDQGTVLQLTAKGTGTAKQFTISGLATATQVAVTGTDAKLTVGNPLAGGYTLTSATNTFTDVTAGLTVTATKLENAVTVSVGADADGIANRVQAMVDIANLALNEIDKQTSYDPLGKKGAALLGDFTVRQLDSDILATVSHGNDDYGDYGKLGVQLTKDGRFTFDKAAFLAAYTADPSTVQSAVQNGLAKDMNAVAKAATDFTIGSLTTAIQGRTSMVTSLNNQISDWDTRLSVRQATLQRQFTSLETALGKMKDQSNWLAGQIASLPTGK
jgi:flagellar hook-associated protein 2